MSVWLRKRVQLRTLLFLPAAAILAAAGFDESLIAGLEAARALYDRQQAELIGDAFDPGEINDALRMPRELFDDPATPQDVIFRFADEAFELERRPGFGFGNALNVAPGGNRPRPNLRRVHFGAFGGPDAIACSGCHSAGGLNGAGTRTQNILIDGNGDTLSSALERNAPHVLGLGPIQALARQMTTQLRARLASARSQAMSSGMPVLAALSSTGVSFGSVVANADGSADFSGLAGIDEDLVVKPFGWKGNFRDLRSISDDSLNIHLGLQSQELIDRALADSDPARIGPVDAGRFDPDGDGIETEALSTELDSFEFYFSMLEIPIVAPPEDTVLLDYWSRGVTHFRAVGCMDCHAVLSLQSPRICVGENADGGSRCVDFLTDPDEPRLGHRINALGEIFSLNPGEGFLVPLFSDLKRHDMGTELAEPRAHRGVPGNTWLTRPLWGLADSAPYLHDGRASTVEEAVLAHGGEGEASRVAYGALSDSDRAALRLFLMSLTRANKLVVQ